MIYYKIKKIRPESIRVGDVINSPSYDRWMRVASLNENQYLTYENGWLEQFIREFDLIEIQVQDESA